jgi:hypothetical protein
LTAVPLHFRHFPHLAERSRNTPDARVMLESKLTPGGTGNRSGVI